MMKWVCKGYIRKSDAGSLCAQLEYASGNRLIEEVALDILVAEEAVRVDRLEDVYKVVKVWVELAELLTMKGVRFSPVRTAAVFCEDILETIE